MVFAGPLLQAWGPHQVFLLATGQLLATIPFAIVAFRHHQSAAVPASS